MKAFWALFTMEAKLAVRGGDMVIFGVAFPVGIMMLIGFISEPEAIRLGFGGIAAVGICASGLMGLPLTFSSYRHGKILKRFRVTPVSPAVLLAANALVQTLFGWTSAAAVYLIARFGFGVEIAGSPMRYIGTFLFVQASIYSLGFLIASLVPNEKTANWVCTLAYFPALFLSGATVPFEILPAGLRAFASAFPLTQGIFLLKNAVLGSDAAADLSRFLALAALAVISYIASAAKFRWD
ncbi:MAG: ABC transporter permease [Spirochaetales bacterium]|nr:ABC transporter permease [Spirochaetales bacterium]